MKKLLVEFYRDGAGLWRWRAKARNGRIVADSGEGYQRRGKALRGAKAALVALKSDLSLAALVGVKPR